MLNKILPTPIDNTYTGRKLAIWLMGVIVFVRTLQSLSVFLDGYSIVREAHGIPLETFSPSAAQAVVALFAISGFSRLLISLLCVLAMVRYRSAVALMYSVLIVEYVGRELIFRIHPLAVVGRPIAPIVNFALFVLAIAGLGLSLWKHHEPMADKAHA